MTIKNIFTNQNKYSAYFTVFALFHVCLWTILPSVIYHNLPLDTLEAIGWGKEWQLGYYKHPPLSAWLAQITSVIFNYQSWSLYFLSQLCVAIAFLTIWRTAKLFLSEEQSLMAALLTEAIYYYNFTSPEFNPNVLLLPLWALMIFFGYQSITKNKLRDWLLFGLFTGLAMLAKYFTILLIISFILLILYQPKFRHTLKTINPYIAAIISLVVFAPHIFWLVANDFPTLKYAASRANSGDNPSYLEHISNALSFSLTQFFSLSFAILIFFISFKKIINKRNFNLANDEKLSFLFFAGFGPFILLNLYSIITASKLRDMWATQFWGLFTIFLFYFFKPNLTAAASKLFYKCIAGIIFLPAIIFILVSFDHSEKFNFNGKFGADLITKEWHNLYNQNLKIVIGDIWLVSNVGFYSEDKPQVLSNMAIEESPWISIEDLKNNGAAIVWNASKEGENLPERFINQCNKIADCEKEFKISKQTTILIPWSGFANKEPYHLGWAIIAPKLNK